MASISTSIDWVTFEDAHVAEFVDTTKRAPAGKQIVQMLLDGELDAVLGEKVEHPDLKPLFADVAAEEKAWFAKHGMLADQSYGGGQHGLVAQSSRCRARGASAAQGVRCRRVERAALHGGRDAPLAAN